jgi:hypothetical protein
MILNLRSSQIVGGAAQQLLHMMWDTKSPEEKLKAYAQSNSHFKALGVEIVEITKVDDGFNVSVRLPNDPGDNNSPESYLAETNKHFTHFISPFIQDQRVNGKKFHIVAI